MPTNHQNLNIPKNFVMKEFPMPNGGMLRIYSLCQGNKPEKQILVQSVDKNGNGKEYLYNSNGVPILEVDSKNNKPHGRAKMYDKNGERIFPNTYWYCGEEIHSGRFFLSQLEEQEKDLLEKEKQDLQANNDNDKIHAIHEKYQKLTDSLYDKDTIEGVLKLHFEIAARQEPLDTPLLKKYFEKDR